MCHVLHTPHKITSLALNYLASLFMMQLLNIRKAEFPEIILFDQAERPSSEDESESNKDNEDPHHCTPDDLMASLAHALTTVSSYYYRIQVAPFN